MSQTSEGGRNQQPTRPPHRGPPHHTDKSQGGAMNSSDAALAKKWKREGMCRKCGKVKTHTGFLMKKLTIDQQVYKGICLRCHSLTQAKLMLNEPLSNDFEHYIRSSIDRRGFQDEEEGDKTSDSGDGRVGVVHMSHHPSGLPAVVSALTRDGDDDSVLTMDTAIMENGLRELRSGEATRNSSEMALGRIPEEYGEGDTIDSYTSLHSYQTALERSRIDSSQTEQEQLERSNSWPRRDLEHNSSGSNNPRLGRGGLSQGNASFVRPGSLQLSSQRNNSASLGRGGSNDSLDPISRVGPVAVSGYELLLERKLAEASLPDSRINANYGNEVPPSSTSTETQRKQFRSLLGSSQTEQNRSNVLTPLQDLNSPGNNEPRLSSGGLSQGNASCVRPGSYQPHQDLYSSQRNNSASLGRGGSNDSLDPISRVGPVAVSGYELLLERKLAEASLPDCRINATSGNEVPSSSTSAETQISQSEQNRSMSLAPQTDLQRNSTSGISSSRRVCGDSSLGNASSAQIDQNVTFSHHSNSASRDMTVGRGGSDECSHSSSQEVTAAVGCVHDTLLARKLADASFSDSRIDSNSGHQVRLASASPGSQTEPDHSILRSSQSEQDRINFLMHQTDLEPNSRVGTMAVGSGHDSLLARKFADAFLSDEQINGSSGNQAPLFPTPTKSTGRPLSDDDDIMTARRLHAHHITLLDRKMASTGNDITQQRCETEECISEVEVREMIADSSRCTELLNTFKRSSSLTQVGVTKTLAKLRDFVLVAHGVTRHDHSMSMESLDSQGPSKIVFPNDAWAKILTTAMTSHSSNIPVQVDLLQTLWFIVTLHPQYVSHLTSIVDMPQIITTMQTHMNEELIQEYGCGVLSSIAAASEGHARRLLRVRNGEFVHRLMAALQFQSQQGNVQVHALKALGHLSLASISDESPRESFSKTMGRYVENGRDIDSAVNAIETVVHAMKDYVANISVQIQGNRLLWSALDPHIMDPDYYDILVVKTLLCVDAAMASHQQSQALHETFICLLSKMSCFQSAANEKDLFFLRLVVEAMKAETMKTHSNSWIVALHGCQCLANICKRSPSLLRSQPVVDGIPVIISCMKIFQDNVAIQSEACAALSFICINSPLNKKRVNEMDGINRINYAYDLFSTTPSVVNKIRACFALTTLAVDPNILLDIEDKGIFAKFETLLKQDQTIAGELHEAIRDLLVLAPDEENRKLLFRDGAREDETCDWLRANLRVAAIKDCEPHHVNYLRSRTIHVMKKFLNSASIHEYGCKLLACLFHQASDDESFAQDRFIAELEIMHHSLKRHIKNPTNTIAACSALRNFIILLSVSMTDNVPGLNDALSRTLAEVTKALVVYGDDVETLERVTGALWALCGVRRSLALSFTTDCSILLIVTAMNRFPDSVGLNRHGIGLMGLFFSVSNNIIDYVTDEVVSVIMRLTRKEIDNDDAADLVDTSVEIILTISNMGFKAVTTLLEDKLLVETVVACMEKFPDSLSIQGAGIDILNNVARDAHSRKDVCQKGGPRRIIATMDNLEHDPIVVCKSFVAFTNLVNGASDEFLHEVRAPVIFVRAMNNHPQNLYIQTVAINALWRLSARKQISNASRALSEINAFVKTDIVDAGGAEAISDAMRRFIASKHIQLPGFAVLWNLAEPSDLKMRVGQCAIEAVTNGLSAHILSMNTDAYTYALGCLKCLSSSPVNRGLLEDYGAADLIFSSLWVHADNAAICNAALATLANVSAYVDTNEVSEITSGDLDAIVNAMRAHQNVQNVQQKAVILLKNLSLCPANIMVMERNPLLVPLIRTARSTWGRSFQGRADDLLRVLPASN